MIAPSVWLMILEVRSSFCWSSLSLVCNLLIFELALQPGAAPLVFRGQPGEVDFRELGLAVVKVVLNGVLLLEILEVVQVAELTDLRKRCSRRRS